MTAQTEMTAPARSLEQRMVALRRANEIRTRRAQLKRDLRAGSVDVADVLADPPEYVRAAKALDILLAVPGVGAVKARALLRGLRISDSKTVGGLSGRQADALVAHFRRRSAA